MARPREVDDETIYRLVRDAKMSPQQVATALRKSISTVYLAIRRYERRPSTSPTMLRLARRVRERWCSTATACERKNACLACEIASWLEAGAA